MSGDVQRACSGGPGDCGGDPACPVACPVTGEAATELLREALAEIALAHWRTSTSGCDCGGMRLGQSYPHHLADALLPVVEAECRRRAAEELRAAAEDLDGDGQGGFAHAVRNLYATDTLRARADAIEGRP